MRDTLPAERTVEPARKQTSFMAPLKEKFMTMSRVEFYYLAISV